MRTVLVAANGKGEPTRLLRDIHTTPGTRLTWFDGLTWLTALREIEARRISAKRYRDLDAHVDALAAAPAFIWSLPLQDLALIDEAVRRRHRRGHRRPAVVRIIDEVHNALQAIRAGRMNP